MSPMVSEYTIPTINVARNAFVRNHSWKGTCDVGNIYPIFFDEALPGDTKELNTTVFGRLNPTVTPVLDNIWCDVHYFFVPNRLVWDNWQKFMGERKNPGDSIDYLVPTINSGESGFTRGELIDCLGVPPAIANLTCSSLVFYLRAYNLIWNEWYRSELLQNSVTVPTGDTGDTESIYKLLPRGKRQDYFTSSFTTPQLGAGASIPLGSINTTFPVVGNGRPFKLLAYDANGQTTSRFFTDYKAKVDSPVNSPSATSSTIQYTVGSIPVGTNTNSVSTAYTGASTGASPATNVEFNSSTAYLGANPSSYLLFGENSTSATVSTVGLNALANNLNIGSVTINTLRQAIALQQFLERDLMRGTRYIELILSHFGVRCPDYRLQRPEYLGGATTRVNINPVVQTSSTDSTSPQGNLTGNGSIGSTGMGFTHSFTEHGVVLGLMSFRVDLNYQQGVDRHFLRNTRYDYYWNTLSHLGMQGIYNKEIFAQGNSVLDTDGVTKVDDKLFGYNTRYEEYRYKNSYITGKFRSSDPQSLDIWHLAENFENLPVLNDEFITVTDTVNRVMAVQTEPEFLIDVWHDYTDIKEVPMYGLPGLERI